jgi:hypothetical protein
MYSTRCTTSRLAILFLLLAMAVLAIVGCGSGSAQPVTPGSQTPDPVSSPEPTSPADQETPDPVSSPEPTSPADQGTTVSGQVVDRDTGQPYAGATVEFKNLYGGNVHTTTDTNGNYSLTLDPGTYTALALDLNNENEGFDVAGRPDNAVTVPPSTMINFVAYPIT